jgi:hypothetical protein
MTVFKDEIELAAFLRDLLLPKFKDVQANVNLASRKFYQDWEKWWSGNSPLAQPQIDLLFVSTDFKLLAAELKYYRLSENAPLNQPYYAGIDEALALLKFGFTCVSLWHFYDSEVPEDVMKNYVRNAWNLIGWLGLRVSYAAFRIYGRQENELKQISLSTLAEVTPMLLPYGTGNPLAANLEAKKALDFIRKALRIPSPQ